MVRNNPEGGRAAEEAGVLAFLKKEPLLRVQALEWMRLGRGKVLAQAEGGALVLDTESGVPMLCAEDVDTALRLLDALPNPDILVCDLEEADGAVMRRLGFTGRAPYHNYVYLSDMPLPEETDVRLLPLPLSEAERVSRHYHIHTLGELREIIRQGRLMGGYAGGELAGFIGWHEEGSIGMLHVFGSYRRKGYGRAMEARLINLTLAQGRRPFGQVGADNDASRRLQEGLGLTRCEKTVSWLFREE